MAIAQVTIVPIGTGSTSLSDFVADLQRVLGKAGPSVRYELTAMSTNIEGELDEILQIVRQMHESPFERGADRKSVV